MHHVVTLQRYSQHQNLIQVQCSPLCNLFDLSNTAMVIRQYVAAPCEYDNA